MKSLLEDVKKAREAYRSGDRAEARRLLVRARKELESRAIPEGVRMCDELLGKLRAVPGEAK